MISDKIHSLRIESCEGPVKGGGAIMLFFVTSDSWLQADVP
jgi:hypothetical protein